MKIALDPGHGGIYTGAIGTVPYELREKDVTLAICLKMKDLLKAAGHKVILTRSSDVHLAETMRDDLRQRAAGRFGRQTRGHIPASRESAGSLSHRRRQTLIHRSFDIQSLDRDAVLAVVSERSIDFFTEPCLAI